MAKLPWRRDRASVKRGQSYFLVVAMHAAAGFAALGLAGFLLLTRC
jgi:hypothetical protein